jgi:hypothetical protein
MTITKEKLAQLDAAIDEWLKMKALCPDEDEDEENVLNPLAAPQQFGDGERGGPPGTIHGEPKRDLFK